MCERRASCALDNSGMQTHSPVKRLHNDIHALKNAQHAKGHDKAELKRDTRTLKTDKRQAQHLHDRFEKNKDALNKDRKRLHTLHDHEKTKLQALEARRADVQRRYDASVDPLTGQGDVGLQTQLAALDQDIAGVHARLDPRIQTATGDRDALKQVLDRQRLALKQDHHAVQRDSRAVKQDNKALAHDAQRVKSHRARAMHDLRPAEYKMGLKGTNAARKDLGLKPVKHVIRPGVANVVGGQVGKWIAEAQTVLKQHGVPLSKMNAHDIATIIKFESGGNPRAVNNWDSNAAAGHPSEGLMQTIGPTFDAYKLHGHGHILNPVDNIIAGVRYAISRYGSISNVPGIQAVHAGGSYVGY